MITPEQEAAIGRFMLQRYGQQKIIATKPKTTIAHAQIRVLSALDSGPKKSSEVAAAAGMTSAHTCATIRRLINIGRVEIVRGQKPRKYRIAAK